MNGMSLTEACRLGALDAHDQAALLTRGELRSIDLVEAAILRVEALDRQLAALSHRAFELARQRASQPLPGAGALAGVPYLLKDSLDYPGMPTVAGSRSRRGVLAHAAFPFARRFDRHGLIPLGKSAMPEFGLMGTTEPLLAAQPVRNPWAPDHSPGGSSGGAAAAVAAGLVPLAHGSDGAGSIRIPASCCGIVGLKPGRGAVVRVRSRHVLDDLMVSDCLMSRSVRDTAWAFAAAHPDEGRAMVCDPAARRLRIAVVEPNLAGNAPDADVGEAVTRAVSLCEALGHRVERTGSPIDGPASMAALLTLWAHLAGDAVDAVRPTLGDARLEDALEPWTLNLADWGRRLPVEALEQAYAQLAALPAQLATFHQDYDAVLSPVLRTAPPRLGVYAPAQAFEALRDGMFDWMGYTPLQNLAGTPAISLPLHWNAAGLPVGVMFSADRGQEDRLLGLAHELERAAPWHGRWPPLSVVSTTCIQGKGRS
jgi:amidase